MSHIHSSDLLTISMYFTHYLNIVNDDENIVSCKVKFITTMKIFRFRLVKLVCSVFCYNNVARILRSCPSIYFIN